MNYERLSLMKNLYIIGGTMGVGKTTVSRLLMKKLPNSVFLDGVALDELQGKMGRRVIPFSGGREFIELVFGDEL